MKDTDENSWRFIGSSSTMGFPTHFCTDTASRDVIREWHKRNVDIILHPCAARTKADTRRGLKARRKRKNPASDR